MRKEIIVDSVNSFYLEINEQDYCLFYSPGDPEWSHPNTLAFKVRNTGNELKYRTEKIGKLNYSEALYLGIILKYMQKEEGYKIEVINEKEEL